MPKTVIKRDGSKEEFVPEKIITSVMKTGVSLDRAREIARSVEKKFENQEVIKTSEIRTFVIKELNKEKQIIEETKSSDAIKEINEAEKRLNNRTSWGTKEILLKSFDSYEEFNKFSREVSVRKNVEIKDVNQYEDEIIVEVTVLAPTRSIIY